MQMIIPLVVTAHIQDQGDVTVSAPQQFVGNKGHSRRLEGFSITAPPGIQLEYMACIEGRGDTPYVPSPYYVGTKGESRSIEGFAIRVVGPAAAQYDVKYYGHINEVGDSSVVSDGAYVGNKGLKRMGGMAVWLEAKGPHGAFPPGVGLSTPYGAPQGAYPPGPSPYPPTGYPQQPGQPQGAYPPGYPPTGSPYSPVTVTVGYTSPPPAVVGYASPPMGYPPVTGHYPSGPSPYPPTGYPPSGYPPAGFPPTYSSGGHKDKKNKHGKLSGRYVIVSCSNGKAIDGNQSASKDHSHPRVFLHEPVYSARNHQWELRHVEGDYYMIVNSDNGKALDGNEAVSQHQHGYPVPFLWQQTPNAHNHQWRFEKVDKKTYVIINRSTGKAIDANIGACSHRDHSLPNPFMWQSTPSAPNHRWKFHQI